MARAALNWAWAGWVGLLGMVALGRAGDAVARGALGVLRDECLTCHGPTKQKAGLSFATHEALMRGSEEGPVVVAGDPGGSRLLAVLEPKAENHMPPRRQLDARQIRALREWIRAGAAWDGGVMEGEPERVGVELKPMPGGHGPAKAVAFSPDGTRLAAGRGGLISLYRVEGTNLALIREVAAHRDAVEAMAWTSDGRFLASGGFQRVRTWSGEDLEPLADEAKGVVGRVTALGFVPGEDVLAVGDAAPGRPGWVRFLGGATRKGGVSWKAAWRAHGDAVLDLEFSGDGTRLVTAGGDGMVRVWDVGARKELATLEGHVAQVMSVAFNTNATWVVSGGTDRSLRVWDIGTKEKVMSLGGPASAHNAVAWVGSAGAIYTVTDGGALVRYTNLKAPHGGAELGVGRRAAAGDVAGGGPWAGGERGWQAHRGVMP